MREQVDNLRASLEDFGEELSAEVGNARVLKLWNGLNATARALVPSVGFMLGQLGQQIEPALLRQIVKLVLEPAAGQLPSVPRGIPLELRRLSCVFYFALGELQREISAAELQEVIDLNLEASKHLLVQS